MNYTRLLILTIIMYGTSILSFAQNVSNVRFEQVGNRVKITYNLDKKADISVFISTDGGKNYSEPLKEVTGDCGSNIGAGNKTVYWDVIAEYGSISGNSFSFRVLATNDTYFTQSKAQGQNLPKKKTFKVNGCRFTMILVEGGTFDMGTPAEQGAKDDERPVHKVTLDSYYIGKIEVTNKLWESVMYGRSVHDGALKGSPLYKNKPAHRLTWNDCLRVILKLNELTGQRFRLPTEAEWEFAARGGNYSRGFIFSGTNNDMDIGVLSWEEWKRYSWSRTPFIVAKRKSNELGIYDMSGNVWEWCIDWYGHYSRDAEINPTGPSYGTLRVVRGGGDIETCRVSARSARAPEDNSQDLALYGFRLVLDLQ